MRKFRNPRYAPESLESRLSPSGVMVAPVYYTIPAPMPTPPPNYPHPGDLPPPNIPMPPLPAGPSGPA